VVEIGSMGEDRIKRAKAAAEGLPALLKKKERI
jgi:hypothetical protein